MATRHLILGGGTAGLNAITTIREFDRGASEITLVSHERPYSRMVLPYYLGRSIMEPHVFTASPARLDALSVIPVFGRKAVRLDASAQLVKLDDDTELPYDDLLIATGSSAVRPPIPGADGRAIENLWTLEQCRNVLAAIRPGTEVTQIGAGFIAFTILNSLLSLGATLTILEVAPRILPRMIDDKGAAIVQSWLERQGVAIQTGVEVEAIEDVGGRKRIRLANKPPVDADQIIMATGIRPNLAWLEGSGLVIRQGVVVDDHLRSNVANVYAAGDVAEGRDLVGGEAAVHAIEPTAMEHGRIVGANMAGQDRAYRGSLLMNIVDVKDLEIASFGKWDAAGAETFEVLDSSRPAYRKLLWNGDRLQGAVILGMAKDIWTTNDVGMLKGLVQTGADLGAWKPYLKANPWDVKRAYVACQTAGRLLPETVVGHPSIPAPLVLAVAQA